jgi:hypothetical protein
MGYSVKVRVSDSDIARCDDALHELCVSVAGDSEESIKKLPDVLKKRMPAVLAMSYDKDKKDKNLFIVYFPVDLPFGMNALLFQAKRKFRKTIREFLMSKGIEAEVK